MYKSHISLEVRILLLTGVKTFCGCAPDEQGAAGTCPICRGESGGRPALNPIAARKAYSVIQGLKGTPVKEAPYECNVNTPKMPEGRALSRLSLKLGTDAYLDIMFHRRKKRIRIEEIRIEEDAGRLTHSGKETRMDYSKAGMPSLRIKTAPDFEIGEEAEVFMSDLRRRIQYLEIIPGIPVESVLRCNAYVSIAPFPEKPRYFVKLRNLNSINFIGKAINTELNRQEEIITHGGTVLPESRIWNETRSSSEPFKKRELDEKPRFIPLEGAAPFVPGPDILEALDNFKVELPESRRDRFMSEYGLTLAQAELVCDEKSRADYFEQSAAKGAGPKECAQWLTGYVLKELRRLHTNLQESRLTPGRFASILTMLRENRINAGTAKQAISAVMEEDREPELVIKERGWEQLTDRKAVTAVVKAVIEENPQEVRRIREGDARPIRFLTGLVMKETGGLAEPSLVKDILREELSVSLVYVLSMGGAISGTVNEDGTVGSGDERILKELLADSENTDASRVRFESVQVGRLLSEEIVPSDWAALIETVADRLNSGTANGIVIAHGTDTLPYTASLLYWLFADASAPIVLAASSTPPGISSEAADTMKKAVELAADKSRGVYVVHGGKILSPLNLKFERIGRDGFRNWNMEEPVFYGSSLLTGPLEADQYVLSQLLEEAVNSMCVVRIYPGLRSDYLVSIMEKGARNFFLELYDTGTAGFREGPYSLKQVFTRGKRIQARFYCTSQQEGIVDFSGYTTSMELWKEGAVPMGPYTTETAVARFLAASIIADNEEEREALMENAGPESLNA
ncbi:asparaginase domain-containing protein [Treponema sp. OttesenSCG-928-L16]|nr:asparaginase domain-containing protein [Treponema sp. OttesenSCG-928-L16]